MEITKKDDTPEPLTPLNWVAAVARLLPHRATFEEGKAKRDRKRRIRITVDSYMLDCVVQDDTPEEVLASLKQLSFIYE